MKHSRTIPCFRWTAALIERQDRANDGAGKSRPFTQWRCIHFLPERFAETLQKATCNECPFIEAEENQNQSVYYPFADVITAEILVGFASDDKAFDSVLGNAMTKTRELILWFTNNSQGLW
jgi:hypothetical protein